MKTTLQLDTKIRLSVSQLTELAKQLPKKERIKLASVLVGDDDSMSKTELLSKIRLGLEEVRKHENGEVVLPTLKDFLSNV
ncbi:hypothetical protein [Dyadobacter sandarakinus]|uniref:Addiction module component n=1 Tax=Dyadobacter sandarakinus TaxID=2747268 RepID=A0ABX7IB41_9BACT|nr:hypothetical protein [Dyadobacter sandarakinus]QRR03332.1 hypothetical protein HWI92_21630 [Dyadobacter sandarakinus]